MHHYRASELALAAAGATVIDRQGRVLRVPVPEPDGADPIRQASGQPLAAARRPVS